MFTRHLDEMAKSVSNFTQEVASKNNPNPVAPRGGYLRVRAISMLKVCSGKHLELCSKELDRWVGQQYQEV